MNIPVVTTILISLSALPFAAGVLLATWRQRRALARRSRDLTIELGPKVLLGVALTGVSAAPVLAAGTPPSSSSAPAWLPDLDRGLVLASPVPHPTPAAVPAAPVTSRPRQSTPPPVTSGDAVTTHRTHVVRPGESLWSITAEHLGPRATISDIAAAWPRLFELNRRLIGSNPRLVLPGQRLVLPPHFDRASS
jgi:nucleoid-associated protein YgaU